jgi:hypothetical protein
VSEACRAEEQASCSTDDCVSSLAYCCANRLAASRTATGGGRAPAPGVGSLSGMVFP